MEGTEGCEGESVACLIGDPSVRVRLEVPALFVGAVGVGDRGQHQGCGGTV